MSSTGVGGQKNIVMIVYVKCDDGWCTINHGFHSPPPTAAAGTYEARIVETYPYLSPISDLVGSRNSGISRII